MVTIGFFLFFFFLIANVKEINSFLLADEHGFWNILFLCLKQ